MEKVPMLDLNRQLRYMESDIRAALDGCLAHQRWILGPEVAELEKRIAEYLGVRHCIGVSSGTDALVLSLRSMAIKLKGKEYFDREDEIITTPFTFTATGDAILRAGGTPVFVDIDPRTFNISPEKIEAYMGRNGKRAVGMVPVHLYGRACDMDAIMDIKARYGLFVVEDAAQSFGASWGRRKIGSLGDAGAFSFFPSKNLGGFGDGGMISTNDDETAALARMLTKHGGKDKYDVEHIGYNARLDTLQAAVLLAKLKHLNEFNALRRHVAAAYTEGLRGLESVVTPSCNGTGVDHVYHQYTLRVPGGWRDQLKKHLAENGVDSMIYYQVPLHGMATFGSRCKVSGDLKETVRAASEVLSLPMEPLLTSQEIARVVAAVGSFSSFKAPFVIERRA